MGKLTYKLLRERSQSERAASAVIPTLRRSGKGKTTETKQRWAVAGGGGRREDGVRPWGVMALELLWFVR